MDDKAISNALAEGLGGAGMVDQGVRRSMYLELRLHESVALDTSRLGISQIY